MGKAGLYNGRDYVVTHGTEDSDLVVISITDEKGGEEIKQVAPGVLAFEVGTRVMFDGEKREVVGQTQKMLNLRPIPGKKRRAYPKSLDLVAEHNKSLD